MLDYSAKLPSTRGREVVRLRRFTKYPSDAPSSTTWTVKYLYRRPDIYGNVYNYRRQDCEYHYFHDVREPLLPLPPPRERLLPLLRSELEPPRNARFEGISAKSTRGRMHVV